MVDLKKIEKKWQTAWKKEKCFEPSIKPKQKKFFLTVPYPYVNFSAHIGHLYTMVRTEAFARYKRAQGFNVLLPQAWHCTGTPIWSNAARVKEREPKVIANLKKEGFTEKDFPKFENPEHWIKVFGKQWFEDLNELGFSIDWRRNFITTSLNPYYDKFIQWQFRKLKEKGLVAKGRHPVVWDPKTNMPVGDHDRVEGEGETPQEFVLLKFKWGNEYLIAATLRPETVFGQTNLWVNPDIEYVKATVNGETWIVSDVCARKLEEQEKEVKVIGKIRGKELVGKCCTAPGIERDIMVLPSFFCDPNIGSGIVTSVPSHAPYDWMGLYDLQRDEELCKQFNVDHEEIKKLKPIALIEVKGWGEHPALEICEKWGIKSQKESEQLEKAKKEIYKAEHFSGVMKKIAGKYAGQKVEKAKEQVKKDLIKEGKAELLYELTGRVVSRSLTECVVKIVSDQWFINYSNEKWKKQTHAALKDTRLYPEVTREQFSYVIDWLNDWACTREFGLGTKLPFDEKWLIESLSDSTIYMAYYTIAHLLKEIPTKDVDDKLFDFIFLGKGTSKIKHSKEMQKEFEYWYPNDFRNSGKDLVQNHLTFFLFNHVALFPKKHWPKSIGVNGWVRVDGQKMSKSLGNMIPLHTIASEFGADISRLTMLNGGEGVDDPNWDSRFAKNIGNKLEQISGLVKNYIKGGSKKQSIDGWMQNRLAFHVEEATKNMDETLFRSAIQKIYFDLTSDIKWYLRRTSSPNKKVLQETLEALITMMQPITPHLAEELWSKIGKKEFVSLQPWPKHKAKKFEDTEEVLKNTMNDIRRLVQLVKKQLKKATIYVIPKELSLYKEANDFLSKELRLEVTIFASNDKKAHDPMKKAAKAKPGRPSLYLE